MDFEKKLLSYLLTEGKYKNCDLRPRDIQLITSPTTYPALTVSINAAAIDVFEAPIQSEKTLIELKKEQYHFLCLLSEITDQKATTLGVTPAQITKLRALSYKDIAMLCNGLKEDIVKINIDQVILDIVIYKSTHLNIEQEIIENLVKAGATKRFMYDHFQVKPKKYKFLREAFKITGTGRPRLLTEKESKEIYYLWQKRKIKPMGETYLDIYIQVNKSTNKQINIRSIASVVEEIVELENHAYQVSESINGIYKKIQ